MSLKEESPVDTGIPDVPVFLGHRESTAKSTHASSFSNASQLPKPEAEDMHMTLSVVATATAGTVTTVTILADDMPATPSSLVTTPRQCTPQPGSTASATDTTTTPETTTTRGSSSTSSSDSTALVALEPTIATAGAETLATPPEDYSSTPLRAVLLEDDDGAFDSVGRDRSESAMHNLDASMVTTVDEAAEPPPSSSDREDGAADPALLSNANAAPASLPPVRPTRRLSSRRTSSAFALAQSSQSAADLPATQATSSPRPIRAARLSRQAALQSPKTTSMPAKPALRSARLSASDISPKMPPKTAKAPAKSSSDSAPKATSKAALQASTKRHSTRLSSGASPQKARAIDDVPASLGKRKRRHTDGAAPISRELRRLADTKEFSHRDDQPVVHTVWSNGKYIPANAAGEPLVDKNATKKSSHQNDDQSGESSRKKTRMTEDAQADEGEDELQKPPQRRVKTWLDKGLYAGQPTPSNAAMGLTASERKQLTALPELTKKYPSNQTLPMPIFNGLRTLIHGRDFKMPFDVFNPLPPGQPKPVKYGRFSKNRFVGDAHAIWRKSPDFDDFSSKCVCKQETGCNEDCQNRIMLYECDDMNCNVGPDYCNNREFQRLAERTASKNPYHIGVEVFKTPNRGHGIRASRSFRPGQIIMEYIGEIITEDESDRRMNEIYKNNACYYLMSFDQSLIIDGTSGSIARFVNHSCSPNCRMIKWIVSGQPRIALFAGDRPIMTGEELTYDYNFDPYSSKNVQTCLCGSENCRGILGPRKSDKAAAKAAAEKAQQAAAKAKGNSKGKRKLDDCSDNKGNGEQASKKVSLSAGAKKGPGRPKSAGSSSPAAARVTTTKAALAALAAKAALDARIAKATMAAKAARAARQAKASETGESSSKPTKPLNRVNSAKAPPKAARAAKYAKTEKVKKAAKTSAKPTTIIKKATTKATKEVKVTKTSKGLKAVKTSRAVTVTARQLTKNGKMVGRPPRQKPKAKTAASRPAMTNVKDTATRKNVKGAKDAKRETIAMEPKRQAPALSLSEKKAMGRATEATPMATALARAAKRAAKDAAVPKKASEATRQSLAKKTIGKAKPARAGVAKPVIVKTIGVVGKRPVGRPRSVTTGQGKAGDKATAKAKADTSAKTGGRSMASSGVKRVKATANGKSSMNFAPEPAIPRRKVGRPRKTVANVSKSKATLAKQPDEPVGRSSATDDGEAESTAVFNDATTHKERVPASRPSESSIARSVFETVVGRVAGAAADVVEAAKAVATGKVFSAEEVIHVHAAA